MEKVLFSDKVQIERKSFILDLCENPRGRFLRMTEDVGGHRDAIFIPVPGLARIRDMIDRAIMVDLQAGHPAEHEE